MACNDDDSDDSCTVARRWFDNGLYFLEHNEAEAAEECFNRAIKGYCGTADNMSDIASVWLAESLLAQDKATEAETILHEISPRLITEARRRGILVLDLITRGKELQTPACLVKYCNDNKTKFIEVN